MSCRIQKPSIASLHMHPFRQWKVSKTSGWNPLSVRMIPDYKLNSKFTIHVSKYAVINLLDKKKFMNNWILPSMEMLYQQTKLKKTIQYTLGWIKRIWKESPLERQENRGQKIKKRETDTYTHTHIYKIGPWVKSALRLYPIHLPVPVPKR